MLELDIELTREQWDSRPLRPSGTMWDYAARLPVDPADVVSLGEGGTPLIEATPALAGPGFAGRVLLKDETGNPTGSFKDRLVSVAVSRALSGDALGLVCASTGNAGASTAAYAARAGIPAVVCVPANAPRAKLAQTSAYGATVVAVEGTYSDAFAVARGLEETSGFVNTTTTYHNPYGVAGLRTVGYEIQDAPGVGHLDAVFVPTGSGPLVRGVQWAYEEATRFDEQKRGHGPALVAVQPTGCAPIVAAFDRGDDEVVAWGEPATMAGGIADPLHGYERDGTYTLALVRSSGGWAIAVDDAEILRAARDLAQQVGVLAELSSAAALAALRLSLARGLVARDAQVVLIITGSGFKDLGLRSETQASWIPFNPRQDSVVDLGERLAGTRT